MLFVTFLLSGIILFLLIYAYSITQLKKQNEESDSSVKPTKLINEKRSIFDRFKRKSSIKNQDDSMESSSMNVGGVTAKVSKVIKDSVTPSVDKDIDKTPLKQERIAPKLTSAESVSTQHEIVKKIDAEKEQNLLDSDDKVENDLTISVKKIEPNKPSPDLIASEQSDHIQSDNSFGEGGNDSVSTEAVPIEQLAEEYIAQQSEANDINPNEVEKVLANQVSEDAQIQKNDQLQPDAVDDVIGADAQQDLLNQFGAESEPVAEQQGNFVQKESVQDHNAQEASVQEGSDQKNNAKPTGSGTKDVEVEKNTHSNESVKREFKAEANAVEIVAKIFDETPVLRDKALVIYRQYDYLFTRYIGIYGRNSLTHVWEDIEQAGQEDQFNDIAISLQLADKTGAMTRKESNTFSTLAVEMSDKLNKKMTFSMDIDESVEKGRMLDELARKYDAMVVCNIIPKRRKGFRSTDIKSCTKDLQMVTAKNGVFGRFAKIGNANSLRYSLALANNEGEYIASTTRDPFQVDEIVVFMNVPLVVAPSEAFQLMIKDARKLGAWMDGKIVDKNAKNMTSRTLEKIAEQIISIEKEMKLDGLIPGSEICKKLF